MQEEHIMAEKIKREDDLLLALNDSNKLGKIILIYTNTEDSQKFSAGIVSKIFENEVIINHYLPNGRYDGFVVKQIDEIYKIEIGSKYAEKIKTLSSIYQVKHDEFDEVQNNGYMTLLTYAFYKNKVVSIELIDSENDDAVGFVKEIDQNSCTIEILNEYGEKDGLVMFPIEDITHLCCDGDEEIILEQLYNSNKKS